MASGVVSAGTSSLESALIIFRRCSQEVEINPQTEIEARVFSSCFLIGSSSAVAD